MKKCISLCLAGLLAVSVFTGCSKEKKTVAPNTQEATKEIVNFNLTGFPIVNESIKLKVMGSKAPIQGGWDKMHAFEELEKLTNISFEFDTPAQQNYEEKKRLAFASGDIPDIFFGGQLSESDEVNYGGQKFLIPLEGFIDQYTPNLKKLFESDLSIKKSITTIDNHIYALPRINAGFGIYPKLWLNKVWLNKVGLKAPATVDEFYTVLKAFKDKDPNGNGKADELPLSYTKDQNVKPGILSSFGFVNTFSSTAAGSPSDVLDVINDKVVFVPMNENFKEYLTFMIKLYSEGLIDQESFTQTTQQFTAKGKEDRIGVFNHSGPFLLVGNEKNQDYIQMEPMTSKVNNKKMWPKFADMNRGVFAITNKNKYPEASMRLVDYLYSQDGSILMARGVKEKDWTYDEVGSFKNLTPQGMNAEEYRGGQVTPDCGGLIPLNRKPLDLITIKGEATSNANNAYIRKETDTKIAPYAKAVFPMVYLSDDDQKKVNSLQNDIRSYVDQMEAKFINGKESLDKWSDYVNTLKKMNIDEYVKIYQTAYDRWKNAK